VPSIANGSYSVTAQGQTTGAFATTPFTILGSFTCIPSTGNSDRTMFTFQGTGFMPNSQVNINDENALTSGMDMCPLYSPGCAIATDASGSFAGQAAVDSPQGTVTVDAVDANGVKRSVPVTLTPWITLREDSTGGPIVTSSGPNEFLIVQGAGFQFNENVYIYFNGGLQTTTAVLYPWSTIAWTFFNVPQLANGTYVVSAVGQSSGITTSQNFVISGMLTLSPTHGLIGSTVTITGTVWEPGETVDIDWNVTYPGSGTLIKTAVTSSTLFPGRFSTTFVVPSATRGVCYQVGAYGENSQVFRHATFCVD
jgi:hypothetical protein